MHTSRILSSLEHFPVALAYTIVLLKRAHALPLTLCLESLWETSLLYNVTCVHIIRLENAQKVYSFARVDLINDYLIYNYGVKMCYGLGYRQTVAAYTAIAFRPLSLINCKARVI